MSGTSGGLGLSAFTVRATDVLGGFDDQALQLAVNLGPLSATCTPPIGEVGVAYSQPACVPKLGLPPYTCALLSGTTPAAGTTLNGDCTLSGTPAVAGSKTFVTRVADSGGLSLNVGTTQTVLSAVRVTTTTLRTLKANTFYTTTLAVTGGKLPYTWSLASGSLPAGLNLSAAGVMSGASGSRRQRVHGPRDRWARRRRRPGPAARGESRTAERDVHAAGRRGRGRLQPAGVRAEARPATVHVRPPERHHPGARHHAERRLHAERHTDRRPAARHS